MSPKEKEKRNNTTTSSTTHTRSDESFEFLKNTPPLRLFGARGLVIMTGEQHAKLCDLLGDEITENYVCQLETYLFSNPEIYLKNHYKTILKWAAEDSSA